MGISVISDGIWLDTLSPVGGLSWTETCPGGMASATWTMGGLPHDFTHPCLMRGKTVQIKDGPTLLGTLLMSEPDRSTWTFTATGLMVEAANYPCLDTDGSGNLVQTTSLNKAVDNAITSGLPWTRPASLGATLVDTDATGANQSQITTLADLITAVCARDNTRWMLSPAGAVSTITLPASADAPTWLLNPGSPQMGVADDNYYSDLYGLYQLSQLVSGSVITATKVAHVSSDAAAARFGRRMKIIDLTALGTNQDTSSSGISLWQAKIANNLSARLAQTGGRLGFTDTIDVLPYQLTSVGGIPAHLPMVKPAQKVRMFGVLDVNGNASGLYTDLVTAQVDHSAADPLIRLTPTGFTSRNIDEVTADAVAAAAGIAS